MVIGRIRETSNDANEFDSPSKGARQERCARDARRGAPLPHSRRIAKLLGREGSCHAINLDPLLNTSPQANRDHYVTSAARRLVVLDTLVTYAARMRWQGTLSRAAVAALLSTAIGVSTFVTSASAQGSLSVTCVASSATQCVATISLVPNMDTDVIVTLPANNGFSMNLLSGTPDSAPSYTSLNNGYWSGTGTPWTCCVLQTGGSEPADAVSTMTFAITPPTSGPTTTLPTKKPRIPAALNLSFAAGSFALSASDKTQLQALARKLIPGAKVTFTGYALSDPTLARNRALSTADFLYARVKVAWKVVSVSNHSLNRVTVTTTAL